MITWVDSEQYHFAGDLTTDLKSDSWKTLELSADTGSTLNLYAKIVCEKNFYGKNAKLSVSRPA